MPILSSGNGLRACLLGLLAFSTYAQAAYDNPYIVSPPGAIPDAKQSWRPRDLGQKVFTLRHIYHHGTHDHPDLHRYLDIPKNAQLYVESDDGTATALETKLKARAMSTNVERMADRRRETIDSLLEYAGDFGHAMSIPPSAWTMDEISGPNYTDKETVITFAKMASNAYTEKPFGDDWKNVKGGFNYTDDFGWKQDGLRGHIFADETNKTVVIGLKGTSMAVFDGADTTGNDKLNDNLFGSCCCAQGGHYTWKQVCDCKADSGYSCNATCVRQALNQKSHYYWAAKDLYHNVTERYPNADVWLSGHSLGGVVSSLIGLTFGLPVFTFEAYPDSLAASRLGLPTPPGYHIGRHQSRADTAIHHFGHSADPVFMGTCGTVGSLCTIAGYAFESNCHTGQKCTYDTVGDWGWRQSVANHKISAVIKDVLEKYDTVANCTTMTDCVDCYQWNFFESNGTETTTSLTSTSTSYSRTRTATCQTPGWWGCLDESTTTTSSATSTSLSSSSSSSSSTTCETPGWFGCLDSTTSTLSTTTISPTVSTTPPAVPAPTITTTSSPTPTSSSTCLTPGFFGCYDETTTAASTSKSLPASTTHSCTSEAWFGLICLDPSPTDEHRRPSSSPSPSPTRLPTTRRKCVSRYWFGVCKQWKDVKGEWRGDL